VAIIKLSLKKRTISRRKDKNISAIFQTFSAKNLIIGQNSLSTRLKTPEKLCKRHYVKGILYIEKFKESIYSVHHGRTNVPQQNGELTLYDEGSWAL